MRQSDRWVTPGVIVTAVVVAGVLVLATIGGVGYLSSIGRDPDPMLKLVGMAVTAASSLGSFLLMLANRATVAKTERNTGVLAAEVYDALAPRHAAPEHGTAPAPAGR